MDPILDHIEQQKHDAYHLERDHRGGVEVGKYTVDGQEYDGCYDCGGVDISDRDARARERAGDTEEPPYRLVCETCGREWEEDR